MENFLCALQYEDPKQRQFAEIQRSVDLCVITMKKQKVGLKELCSLCFLVIAIQKFDLLAVDLKKKKKKHQANARARYHFMLRLHGSLTIPCEEV